MRHPKDLGEVDVNRFLTRLATEGRVSASTQQQALSALVFLYRHVVGRELGALGELVRARRPQRLPVVLSPKEIEAVLAQMEGDTWLMASLMYGRGTCDRLNDLVELLRTLIAQLSSNLSTAGDVMDRPRWLQTYDRINEEIPVARGALDEEFRRVLGIATGSRS